MPIKNIDYKVNKQETMEGLAQYFIEKCPEAPNYDTREDKEVSLIFEDEECKAILGRLFAIINYDMMHLKVEGLFIEAEARGKGIGKKLLQEAETVALQEGCNIAFVDTSVSSAPTFYEKQGYSLIGELKDYPFPNETYYYYVKRLK